jgi:hypothetical protein
MGSAIVVALFSDFHGGHTTRGLYLSVVGKCGAFAKIGNHDYLTTQPSTTGTQASAKVTRKKFSPRHPINANC